MNLLARLRTRTAGVGDSLPELADIKVVVRRLPVPPWGLRAVRSIVASARRCFALFTPLGLTVLGLMMVTWIVGSQGDWVEYTTIAATLLAALAIGAVFMLGRDSIAVDLTLHPQRVVVGESTAGEVVATNQLSRRILPFRVESPVGEALLVTDVPSLGANGSFDDGFIIPTRRRDVIVVGPARSVRGDPLGMMRRDVAYAPPTKLFVHPVTTSLAGLASGWIRDLEGLATNELSPSDIAFHTLREYVPGDDRRHVHWRTSARVGTLMVRQFVDSRRSHLAIVLDSATDRYANESEFELAVSVAASLGKRALTDGQEVSCIAGDAPLQCRSRDDFLDSCAGIKFGTGPTDLSTLALRSAPMVTSASVITLISGSGAAIPDFRLAAQWFPADLRILSIRVTLDGPSSARPVGPATLIDIGDLNSLGALMRAAGGL